MKKIITLLFLFFTSFAFGQNQLVQNLTATAGVTSLAYTANSNTTTYAATTTIDLTKNLQTVSLTGNVIFQTSNRTAGKYVTVRVICDGTLRTLTFPSWKFVGTVAPANIVAGKVALLTLVCFGTAETDIIASWVSEP